MHAYAQDALFVSARKLKLFAQQHSAPFYLYDEAGIRRTATQLQGAFGRFAGFRQYFPVALNPNPALLQLLCQLGYGAVCENAAQLQLAEHAGFSGTALRSGMSDCSAGGCGRFGSCTSEAKDGALGAAEDARYASTVMVLKKSF